MIRHLSRTSVIDLLLIQPFTLCILRFSIGWGQAYIIFNLGMLSISASLLCSLYYKSVNVSHPAASDQWNYVHFHRLLFHWNWFSTFRFDHLHIKESATQAIRALGYINLQQLLYLFHFAQSSSYDMETFVIECIYKAFYCFLSRVRLWNGIYTVVGLTISKTLHES